MRVLRQIKDQKGKERLEMKKYIYMEKVRKWGIVKMPEQFQYKKLKISIAILIKERRLEYFDIRSWRYWNSSSKFQYISRQMNNVNSHLDTHC